MVGFIRKNFDDKFRKFQKSVDITLYRHYNSVYKINTEVNTMYENYEDNYEMTNQDIYDYCTGLYDMWGETRCCNNCQFECNGECGFETPPFDWTDEYFSGEDWEGRYR